MDRPSLENVFAEKKFLKKPFQAGIKSIPGRLLDRYPGKLIAPAEPKREKDRRYDKPND